MGIAAMPGVYLNADMDDSVLLKFAGRSVGIMKRVNPTYASHTTVEKGREVLLTYIYAKRCTGNPNVRCELHHRGVAMISGMVHGRYENVARESRRRECICICICIWKSGN